MLLKTQAHVAIFTSTLGHMVKVPHTGSCAISVVLVLLVIASNIIKFILVYLPVKFVSLYLPYVLN